MSLRGVRPPADVPRSRSPIVAVIATLVVVAAGVGGYYGFRAIGGTGSTDSIPIGEAGLAGGGEAVAPGAPDPTMPVAEDAVAPVPASAPVVPLLEVTSNPPGAAVSFNGVDTGEITPASIPLEEPYPQTVGLTLAGYRPLSREIPPVDGDAVEMPFGELTRTLGRIGLPDDYPFEVWIGDVQYREKGDSREITEVRTGAVTVYLRNEEYFLNMRNDIVVVADERVELEAPELGSLTVRSNNEACQFFVDSESIGYHPITRREIAPGTYTVSRQCPDPQQDSDQQKTVVAGQEETVVFGRVQ